MNREKPHFAELEKRVYKLNEQATTIRTSDPESCINIGREVVRIATENNYSVGIGIGHQQIGAGYFHQGNFKKALEHYTEAEKIFQKNRYYRGLRSIYNNIGIIYIEWNDLEKALQFFKENLKLESEYSDPRLTCSILSNLGRVYSQLNDNHKALQYYKESLSISQKNRFLYDESISLLNIGSRYLVLNETEKAEKYLLKAIEINELTNNISCLVNSYASLSELKSGAGKTEEALSYLNKALNYAKKLDESAKIANIYLAYAKIYKTTGNGDEREKYLHKCISIAEPNGYKSTALSAYAAISELYEEKQNYKAALSYYKKFQKIKDYLNDEKRLRAIHGILAKLEVERTEKEKRLMTVRNTFDKLLNNEGYAEKHQIVFVSEKMNEILFLMDQVAAVENTDVLVTGESGTGKELVARGIHLLSSRKDRVFFDVNCTAVPDNLFESEFFGHVKGAFTGADSHKKGVFEAADNGTLFLDEIGDLPMNMQTKLLRVLEERKIRRVGSLDDISLNIRIIASTNQNIAEKIEQNLFRKDLYYRLNKFHIHVPPIRERVDDIIPLVNYYIEKFCLAMRKPVKRLSPNTIDALCRYEFPGNVRELKNMIEKAVILSRDNDTYFVISDLNGQRPSNILELTEVRVRDLSPETIAEKEIEAIVEAMKKTNNNKTQAAKLLKINRSSLRRRIDKYKLIFPE